MYRLDYSNAKSMYSIVRIIFLVSIIFLTIGVFTLKNTHGDKKRLSAFTYTTDTTYTTYRSSKKNRMYTPIYHYKVNGINYTCTAIVSSSSRPSKKITKVFYAPYNPSDCMGEEDESVRNITSVIMLVIGTILSVAGAKKWRDANTKIADMKYLAQNGKLIKNLPYKMVSTNITINDRELYAIEAIYTTKNGTIHRFRGEPRFDHKSLDFDGMVDLLIDPNDVKRYHVDFDIN